MYKYLFCILYKNTKGDKIFPYYVFILLYFCIIYFLYYNTHNLKLQLLLTLFLTINFLFLYQCPEETCSWELLK